MVSKLHLDLKKNLGHTDRIIRVTIGLLLLVLVFTDAVRGLWAAAAVVLALFQFIEAYLAY